jgi:hypothetical protein
MNVNLETPTSLRAQAAAANAPAAPAGATHRGLVHRTEAREGESQGLQALGKNRLQTLTTDALRRIASGVTRGGRLSWAIAQRRIGPALTALHAGARPDGVAQRATTQTKSVPSLIQSLPVDEQINSPSALALRAHALPPNEAPQAVAELCPTVARWGGKRQTRELAASACVGAHGVARSAVSAAVAAAARENVRAVIVRPGITMEANTARLVALCASTHDAAAQRQRYTSGQRWTDTGWQVSTALFHSKE